MLFNFIVGLHLGNYFTYFRNDTKHGDEHRRYSGPDEQGDNDYFYYIHV